MREITIIPNEKTQKAIEDTENNVNLVNNNTIEDFFKGLGLKKK